MSPEPPFAENPPTLPPARDRALAICCVVGILLCAAMTVFQFMRASDGNDRSWFYMFEWPVFALFILFVWRKLDSRPKDEGVPDADNPPKSELEGD